VGRAAAVDSAQNGHFHLTARFLPVGRSQRKDRQGKCPWNPGQL